MPRSTTTQIALTIGMFDGVHRGHQALIQAARLAVGRKGTVVAITFDPNPAEVLRTPDDGDVPAQRLTSVQRREKLLLAAGADQVQVIAVDRAFLDQSAEAFLQAHVLPHRPTVLVEGDDFRFGKGRSGDLDLLRALEGTHGWSVEVVDECMATLGDGVQVPVRSSMVRWLLLAGRVREAGTLLGRAFVLDGAVCKGAQRGRLLGVPTANVSTGDLLVPMDGVYAGVGVLPDGQRVPAAISIGTNPTFGDEHRSVEAHLLDFNGAIGDYGWTLELELHRWLRDQVACSDTDALLALIHRDIEAVRAACSLSDYAFAP